MPVQIAETVVFVLLLAFLAGCSRADSDPQRNAKQATPTRSPQKALHIPEQVDPGEYFPWKDVQQCLNKPELTFRGRPEDPETRRSLLMRALSNVQAPAFVTTAPENIEDIDSCPGCGKPSTELTWLFFVSPEETWTDMEGRAGWLVICPDCPKQVDFFCLIRN